MAINWTEEQAKAINAPVSNLLVSAAAGSGKTQVLTGRILKRIIEDKLNINEILIVTFTNAAASEMRERILKNISEALGGAPDNAHLKKQLSLINGASITTIHSFCYEIIKNNYLDAGLDSGYRIADGGESDLLREEAAENAIERLFGKGDELFASFAECYSGARSHSNLCQLAINIYKFCEGMLCPDEWLGNVISSYEVKSPEEVKNSDFGKYILSSAKAKCERALRIIREGLLKCPDYHNVFSDDLAMFERILGSLGDWDSAYGELSRLAWTRMPSSKKIDEKEAELAKAYRDEIKAIGKELLALLPYSADETLGILKKAYPHAKALCTLAKTFTEEYQILKTENRLLDYSDLERIAIKLLSCDGGPSDIAVNLRNKYNEIYIDEYQDSNEVQETIFRLISREHTGEPNIFMVGDVKQSIYGFRNTSPKLFMEKKDSYGTSGKNIKCLLSKNFRSRPEIISYVNSVFEKVFQRELCGIEYNEEEYLFAEAEFPENSENRVEIAILDKEDGDFDKESEASYIAGKIKEIVETKKVYDKDAKALRPVKYSDIVILLRSLKGNTEVIEEALTEAGIPVYTEKGAGFYEYNEISLILALLTVIDNPINDIQLLSVMRSYFFGFTENELAQIRAYQKKSDYYYALVRASKSDTPLGHKAYGMLSQIKKWRRQSEYLQVDELIWKIYTDTDYLNHVSFLENGEQKRANLILLFEKARQFENISFNGLFNFLNYVSKTRSKEESGGAKLVGENHNVVRIMSIHKSKGLEFPVVFLSNCGKKFNLRDTTGSFLLDKDLGLGLKYVDPELRIFYDAPTKIAVAEKMKADFLAEELRVLYVALTRAREYLYITGIVKSVDKQKGKWQSCTFLPAEIMDCQSYINILASCAVHSGCGVAGDENFSPDNLIKLEFVRDINSFSAAKRSEVSLPENLEFMDSVSSVLEYKYPSRSLLELPSKITVTELKRLTEAENTDSVVLYKNDKLKTPDFMTDSASVSQIKKGSLLHFVMQNIDYKAVNSEDDVRKYIESLAKEKIISEKEAETIDAGKIAGFFSTDLGKRMKNADRVYREVPFSMVVPASVLTGNAEHFTEKVILQGIIDCYFFEGDRITLLDYKSDTITSREKVLQRYRFQIDTYEKALEKKYFSKIFQKVIYLFENNDIIDVAK